MKPSQVLASYKTARKAAIAAAKSTPPTVGSTITVCVILGGIQGSYTCATIAAITPKAYKLERMGRSIWLPKAALEVTLECGSYSADLKSWFKCDRVQDDFLS